MIRISLAFIILLLAISYIYADVLPAEEAERQAKERQLEQLADKFKAETGFVGDIGISHRAMKFSNYRGIFPMKFSNYRGIFRDISVTAPQDTAIMRQVFEQVVSKIMPYISASEGQLFRENVRSTIGRTSVTYRQIVNGYRLERDGVLNLAYNFATSEFVVTDNTKKITAELVPINISIAQAIKEAIQLIEPSYKYDDNNILTQPNTQLVYCLLPDTNGSSHFRLCYKIGLSVWVVYINPSSGEIVHTRKGYKTN